jgi:hypothetical protein
MLLVPMNGSIQVAILAMVTLAAIKWGGWPERAGAFAFIVMDLIDWYYHWLISGPGTYRSIDIGHLIVDSYMMVAMLALALEADRQWTLWAAAAQVVALMSHPIRLLSGAVDTVAYAIMIRAPSWVQLALIVVGTIAHAHRCRLRSSRRWESGEL